jgi:Ca2+/Na+ antiporter
MLTHKEASDARLVAVYTLAIMLTTLAGVYLLSLLPSHLASSAALFTTIVLIITNILTLGFFAALSYHALHRVPHTEDVVTTTEETSQRKSPSSASVRTIGTALLALGIALSGVVVMVQSGQAAAAIVHMPPAILGLFVLAVATSLPNTVVAFTLAHTHRATACVEEVLSSNSINAAFGIALPLLIWHNVLHDQLLLWLDTPLMAALTLVTLICVMRQRVSHTDGFILLGVYVVWVGVHMFA